MKPKMRTKEWLVSARRLADLSQSELLDLVGLTSGMSISFFESGRRNPRPATWGKIEKALYPYAPIMFVDEDDLIADVDAGARWEKDDALCRLYYVPGRSGMVFVGVGSSQDKESSEACITVSFSEARRLLEAQKGVLSPRVLQKVEESPMQEESEGMRLRGLRRALGLSQSKVAELAGLPQPTISEIELDKEKGAHLVERYRKLLEGLTAES